MILWTCQYDEAWAILRGKGRLTMPWRRVQRNWEPAYRWMAEQMVLRGICRKPIAPIWAWHSCGAYRGRPRKGDIDGLFGCDGRTGVTIQFDAPDWLVLLSVYGPWNDIIDDVLLGQKKPHRLDPVRRKWSRIFDIESHRYSKGEWRNRGGNHYDIQACLPFLDKSWVLGVKPFRLPDLSYSAAIRKSLRLKKGQD